MNIYFVAMLCLLSFLAGALVQELTRDWPAKKWMDED